METVDSLGRGQAVYESIAHLESVDRRLDEGKRGHLVR